MQLRRPHHRNGLRGLPAAAALAGGLVFAAASAAESDLPETVGFNRDIRPILSDKCFHCHGFDAESRKADLRLDTPEGAFALLAGATDEYAIVPGDPAGSAAARRIASEDEGEVMPPPEFNKPLDAREIALIHRWIEQGAAYEEHWAFRPVERPEPPSIASEELEKQVRNEVDRFIFTDLEERGLAPSPEAPRAALLRRLSLDLTGLPPTPRELEDFLADESPEAYERQVERLLASPRYAERMAVPWLDAVRYADTVGYHGDQNARIFPYRDYVIDAFASNKPFDRFTREQLAGDLFENPTPEQLVATGFLRLNLMTREGGAQPAEYLAKYAADRVRSLGGAWLGLTTGCAECHDHKFDPFGIRDFYALAAFFDDVREWGVYNDYRYTPNPDLQGWSNEHPFPPELVVESRSLRERIGASFRAGFAALAEESPPSGPEEEGFAAWAGRAREFLERNPDGWLALEPEDVASSAGTPVARAGGEAGDAATLVFTGPPQEDDEIVLDFLLPEGEFRALRLEILPREENGGRVGRGEGGRFAVTATFELGGEELAPAYAQADRRTPHRYSNGRHDPLLEEEWRSAPARWEEPSDAASLPHHAHFHLPETLRGREGEPLRVTLRSDDLGAARVSLSPFPDPVPGWPAAPSPEVAAALAVPLAELDAEGRAQLEGIYRLLRTPEGELPAAYLGHRARVLDSYAGLAHTQISQPVPEEEIVPTRLLPRGEWMNPGDPVRPAFPEFLAGPAAEGGARLTRLDLADWIVSEENPLTARHFVNRLWKQFFGKGLSDALDDLGSQGEWPSHPELLDWLAAEFRESGWDVKHLAGLMVRSHAYRQDSLRDAPPAADPENRLLSAQSPRRLEAEFIRDNALAIAGLLDTRLLGGPPNRPWQPEGYYENLNFPIRDYEPSDAFEQHRRGVYAHWQRTFLHPMMAGFDAPSREECAPDRHHSNSPQQALILLNDPAFTEAAEALAARLAAELPEGGDAERVALAYRLALAREPEQSELASLLAFLESLREAGEGGADEGAAPDAALRQLARVVLNLHETITVF